MIFRCFLVVLILLFIGVSHVYSSSILFYVLSSRDDSGGWYTDPKDTSLLVEPVEKDGHTVKVEDETTLKDLTLNVLSKYEQAWILEGDEDTNVEVSAKEADELYEYYRQGHVIWISTESGAWTEDAGVFLERFGISIEAEVAGKASPQVKGDHLLLKGLKTLKFDEGVGSMKVSNTDVKVIWKYPSNTGDKDAIAVLDKEGYAVFDSGWVAGYAYRPEGAGDSNIQFALNIARLASKLSIEYHSQSLSTTWANVKAIIK